jgi:hypothetical protein
MCSRCMARFDCVVSFGAESGSKAYEGAAGNRNSVYTRALIERIDRDGHVVDVKTLLDNVWETVVAASDGAVDDQGDAIPPQVPWVSYSMRPMSRYLVQLGSTLPLHSAIALGVTIGEVVGPLVRASEDQVC